VEARALTTYKHQYQTSLIHIEDEDSLAGVITVLSPEHHAASKRGFIPDPTRSLLTPLIAMSGWKKYCGKFY
jgi:hypothetical protein